MGRSKLREDIPINLPSEVADEALEIRNMLLMFRFRNLKIQRADSNLVDRSIEPRLNQIFVPLLSVIEDENIRAEIRDIAKEYSREMVSEREMEAETEVLEIIQELASKTDGDQISIREITQAFVERHGQEYERTITTKWIGSIIRRNLHLATYKSHGIFVIARPEKYKLDGLRAKYGLIDIQDPQS
jgi:hypothetical protein